MIKLSPRTTQRIELVEITADVRRAVHHSKALNGVCVIYCPHTTAGLTIQENADPDVVKDLLLWMNAAVPKDYPGFTHAEGNSDAHIKAAMMGSSVMIPFEAGALQLGTWQGIYFCEFDGPRVRQVFISILPGE